MRLALAREMPGQSARRGASAFVLNVALQHVNDGMLRNRKGQGDSCVGASYRVAGKRRRPKMTVGWPRSLHRIVTLFKIGQHSCVVPPFGGDAAATLSRKLSGLRVDVPSRPVSP